MYTFQMIAERLNPSLIKDPDLFHKDYIASIRIDTGAARKDHVLYLSLSEDGSQTFLQTKRGSSLTYQTNLTDCLNQLLEIMEHYTSWEQEFTAACRQGCTLTELLDLAYPMLTYPLIILDNHEWMVACSSALRVSEGNLNEDLTAMLKSRSSAADKIAEFNKRFHDCFRRKDVYKIPGKIFTNNGYAFNLFHNGKLSGILLTELFRDPVVEGKLDLFQLIGEHIQSMLNDPSSGLSIGTEESALHAYLSEASEEHKNRMLHDLQLSSWHHTDLKQAIYIAPCKGQHLSPNTSHALLMFNRLFALKAAEYQDGIVLLVNQRILSERSGFDPILQRIGQLSYCAGISNTFSDISQLPVMVQRAFIALQKGDQRSGSVNYFEDHYLQYLLSMFKKEDAPVFMHPFPEQLKQYDRRFGSHLYETLFHYLENERSISKTAQAMNLHRSTLIHRIERIVEMSGGILEQPESRMHILISYYLPDSFSQ